MLAYETLWAMPDVTQKLLAAEFHERELLPSELFERIRSELLEHEALFENVGRFLEHLRGFSVSVHRALQYPSRLRAARYPIELFYYKGDIGLVESRSVSVVGTRQCSDDGRRRTEKLVRGLVEADFTIVSGLASGIDTVAMQTAVKEDGTTIGVIGTPITEYYPKDNRDLQDRIACDFCLISQVPIYRYHHEPFQSRRRYFPQRNVTMAALSEATVIVEASESSGTLTQARACLQQGKKLFILNSCFEAGLKWPHEYERRGAIRVRSLNDIFDNLDNSGNAKPLEED